MNMNKKESKTKKTFFLSSNPFPAIFSTSDSCCFAKFMAKFVLIRVYSWLNLLLIRVDSRNSWPNLLLIRVDSRRFVANSVSPLPRNLIHYNRGGHRYVERWNLAQHGDGHQEVAFLAHLFMQTISFGAQHQCAIHVVIKLVVKLAAAFIQ